MDETARELRDALLETNERLTELKRDVPKPLRRKIHEHKKRIKDLLTRLADEGQIEWESPYRERNSAIKRS